jgi:hypothetical protein
MAFTSAIGGMRKVGKPDNLAHGLLDYAEHLADGGQSEAAAAAIEEAGAIGRRLGCQPLIGRAEAIKGAKSRTRP